MQACVIDKKAHDIELAQEELEKLLKEFVQTTPLPPDNNPPSDAEVIQWATQVLTEKGLLDG